MKIVVLGTGNVGTQLSYALFEKGMGPSLVYNRHGDKAAALAARLGCGWTDDLQQLPTDADLLDMWQRQDWAALYRQMSELIYARHNRQI